MKMSRDVRVGREVGLALRELMKEFHAKMRRVSREVGTFDWSQFSRQDYGPTKGEEIRISRNKPEVFYPLPRDPKTGRMMKARKIFPNY